MACELFAHVSVELLKTGKIKAVSNGQSILPVSEVRHRLAYTTYEQAMIIKELQARFAKAPFTAQSDNAIRQKLYAERAEVASRMLAKQETKDGLVAIYERALAARPDDWMLRRNAGMAYVALGLTERALPLLEQACTVIADDADTLFALATAQGQSGQTDKAEKTFTTLRELEPRYPGLPPAKI
jgi:tetratricopeptide (TPR) repeat protein